MRNISGAGYENILAFDRVALCCEHFLGEVYVAVASRFGTNQASAPFEALAGENAVIGILAALVLAKEVAYFAAAHADVAGGNVGIGADVAIELAHKGVAEVADFVVAFSLRVEVGTAFAAAHGQGREGVLKYLFKTEEFENAEVYRRVEAQTALVGAYGAIELYAVALVYMYLTLVVRPRNLEEYYSFGNDHSFENFILFVKRIGVDNSSQRRKNFFRRLEEFFFPGLLGFQFAENFLHILIHDIFPFG